VDVETSPYSAAGESLLAGRADVTGRVRPVAHFTPRRGWINDPYGVRWDGDRYHMYYQAVPDQTRWSPACLWGHALSDDLVSWEERAPALVPGPHELGCWSGSVIEDAAGGARAFYTRVQTGRLEVGSIAVARCGGSGRPASGVNDVVIGGPPDDMAVTAFRDPFLWRGPDGWTMIVGAGTADGTGAVLQYRSVDLERWEYTGVLSRGRVAIGRAPGTQVWECPQMIEIDGVWVLVVSVQVNGRAGPVVASAGSYDGARFSGEQWHRLVLGTAPYATSVFRDRAGRPCMISWLREDPRGEVLGGAWAGAQSLVSELAIDAAGKLTADPHPSLRRSELFAHHEPAAMPLVHDLTEFGRAPATHLLASAGRPVEIELRGAERGPVCVTRSPHHGLVIDRPGRPPDAVPCPNPQAIELFIDADILELYSGGVYGAWRLTS
jgi:beta-fructofuranosidase